MDLFDVLKLIGGLCLFLFGMNVMGAALEKRAGHGLSALLGRLTGGRLAGFLTGLAVTAVIQSSSATTVMVVGFVNSGIMSLKQAINVIMGANVGTTVTAWLLSLTGIESGNLFVQLLKPTSFTPILALIGIILYMTGGSKKKDTGSILLGFATLMMGMDTMSAAVSGLKNVPEFRNILTMFTNPVLGVLAGAVLTAVIQSSSASVGILQALSSTGQVNFGMAVPIIMGQNIGTCVTALLSSVGTSRSARRASIVHLSFNIIGTAVMLALFTLARSIFDLSAFVNSAAGEMGIAIAHSAFNILCTALLLPMSGLLEKLSYRIVPEPAGGAAEPVTRLDERLMATPAVALEQCRLLTVEMADTSVQAVRTASAAFEAYSTEAAAAVREGEAMADKYEDALGSYLVKLNSLSLSGEDSAESAKLLHMIGDLERLSDHAVNILCSAEELREKGIEFTPAAKLELKSVLAAADEILELALRAFRESDMEAAMKVEPLRMVVEDMKARFRSSHIMRMQRGECTIEAGFVWADLLTNIGRIADHCSNIAGCVVEMSGNRLDLHDYSRALRSGNENYEQLYRAYSEKYKEKA